MEVYLTQPQVTMTQEYFTTNKRAVNIPCFAVPYYIMKAWIKVEALYGVCACKQVRRENICLATTPCLF